MKNIVTYILISFCILALISCGENSGNTGEKDNRETFFSDNSELQEAKAISRKIYEGIEKVEKDQLSREEFQAYAKPLQQRLNSLIIHMDEKDVKELDRYRNRLMENLDLSDTQPN